MTVPELNTVDAIEVIALMDNVSDPFTKSHDNMRWNEFQYQFGINQRREFSGADLCRACTGLSLLFKITSGDKTHKLLFDTGPDDGLVVENAKRLGIDLNDIDAIVISHGHFDHYGGLISVLNSIDKKAMPVHTHPDLFDPRAHGTSDEDKVVTSYVLTEEEVRSHGGDVISNKDPVAILDDTVLLSGEVPRNTAYESGLPSEFRKINGVWEKNPLVIDERCLMLKLKNKGLCIITGCGHTGVVNACQHAMQLTSCNDIHLLMGGFHLAGSSFEDRIDGTISDLVAIDPHYLVTGHCTGMKAQIGLHNAFGDRHIPYGVGTIFRFE